jgi:hypothetical protein
MSEMQQTARRRSRFWLYLPFALLFGFSLVWTGLWFYGRGKVTEVMDKAFADLAAQGRTIACPERSVSGFPFRMQVTCEKPSFAVTGPDGEASGSIGRLVVNARALDPTAIVAVLEGPFVLKGANGESTINWSEARLSVRASGATLGAFDIIASDVVADLPAANTPSGRLKAMIRRLKADILQRDGTVTTDRADYALVAKLEGLGAEGLPVTPATAPVDLELQMIASKLPLRPEGQAAEMLDAWRDAGGTAQLVLFKATQGEISAEAKGDLKIDGNRFLEGKLDVAFRNLDTIATALGLKVNALALPLLKNGKAPIGFGGGRMSLGPLPIGNLPPLY